MKPSFIMTGQVFLNVMADCFFYPALHTTNFLLTLFDFFFYLINVTGVCRKACSSFLQHLHLGKGHPNLSSDTVEFCKG